MLYVHGIFLLDFLGCQPAYKAKLKKGTLYFITQ